MITWITGNTGAGKTTLAFRMKKDEVVLDGDALRKIWTDLGFSEADRRENNFRTARLAMMLEGQGFDVIVSTICPYKDLRGEIQKMCGCRFIYLDNGRPSTADHPYEI